MGNEAINSFFQKMSEDDALREEFKGAIEGAVVDLAQRHGCDFTAEDLAQRLLGELGDDDLENVAGGRVELNVSRDMSSELLLAGLTRGITEGPRGIDAGFKW